MDFNHLLAVIVSKICFKNDYIKVTWLWKQYPTITSILSEEPDHKENEESMFLKNIQQIEITILTIPQSATIPALE